MDNRADWQLGLTSAPTVQYHPAATGPNKSNKLSVVSYDLNRQQVIPLSPICFTLIYEDSARTKLTTQGSRSRTSTRLHLPPNPIPFQASQTIQPNPIPSNPNSLVPRSIHPLLDMGPPPSSCSISSNLGCFLSSPYPYFYEWIHVEQNQECSLYRSQSRWASQLDCWWLSESIGD